MKDYPLQKPTGRGAAKAPRLWRTGNIGRQLLLAVVLVWPLVLGVANPAMGAGLELLALCRAFDALDAAIRDDRIGKAPAQAQLGKLLGQIRAVYYAAGGRDYPPREWVFPLQGYDRKAIGGVNGSGYQPGGYDYFDGNRHSGHPSLDIFIRDRQQRELDDGTGEPVPVLSITGGVVVAAATQWDPTSPLRGGKYLWIYDPGAAVLLYYAHHREVLVAVGDLVRPGDVIARVGRTGLNARHSRSPTHLHLTCLSVATGRPVPRNIYPELAGRPAL